MIRLIAAALALLALPAMAQAPAGPFGIAAKRPVLAAACSGCPWGALADKLAEAMAPLGYDVQVCHDCSGTDDIRIVDERRRPPPLNARQIAAGMPVPPDAAADFGVVAGEFAYEAWHRTGRYAADPPRPNLRLIARIEDPNYYFVALRGGGLVTDLADIAAKHIPAVIAMDDKALGDAILAYYHIDPASLAGWGGKVLRGPSPEREHADVVMGFAEGLNNTPESGGWYRLSQIAELHFVQLPEPLLAQLTGPVWSVRAAPVNLIRGLDRPLRVPVSDGTLVYARADVPDGFAYAVARALDRGKGLLKWSIIPFSYEPETVWRYDDIPLHPGAARYYRERGYMR